MALTRQTAIIWEADEPGEHVELTYEQLLQEVCKTANILKSYGVKKGDVSRLFTPTSSFRRKLTPSCTIFQTVAIYLPM